jgi:hypothetical protein
VVCFAPIPEPTERQQRADEGDHDPQKDEECLARGSPYDGPDEIDT